MLKFVSFPKWLFHCIILHLCQPYERALVSSNPWQLLVSSVFLILGILMGVNRYFVVALLCISLMTNDVKSFHALTCHLHIFFGKCLPKSSAYLKNFFSSYYWLVRFLIIEFYEFIMYSGYKSFIRYVWQMFSPGQWLALFIFLVACFEKIFLNLHKIQFIIFFSIMECFWWHIFSLFSSRSL